MTLSEQALQVAITQIGQEEKPRGSNWGHPVQDYLASVGINFPAAWCIAFLHWAFDHAALQMGITNPMLKTGGVLHLWINDKAHFSISPKVDNIKPGDIFIMDFGGGLGHCGVVESRDGATGLNTIEGNTNLDGSRDGYAVERKQRQITNPKIIGYLRYF